MSYISNFISCHNDLGNAATILVGKKGEMSWEQRKVKGGNLSALSFQKESKLTTPVWKGNRLLLRNVQIKHMLSSLH